MSYRTRSMRFEVDATHSNTNVFTRQRVVTSKKHNVVYVYVYNFFYHLFISKTTEWNLPTIRRNPMRFLVSMRLRLRFRKSISYGVIEF